MNAVELSIVMPVYNEEKVLASSIEEALSAIKDAPFSSEIVLCNDASLDGSGKILSEYEQKYPDTIRVLTHSENQGIMGSLATLFSEAHGKYVFFNSSDGQFKTSDCLKMMAVREQYDIIVGEREQKLYNWRRHFVSWSFNILPKLFFGTDTHDAGSVKLYTKEVLQIPLISESPFREAERIIRAKRLGYRIGVVPVSHHQRRAGRATGSEVRLLIHSFVDLLRCLSLHFTPVKKWGLRRAK